MKSHRFFRYLWRTNAVLIFLATAGSCLLVGGVTLSEVACNARHRRAVEAAPQVVTDSREKLYLGPMRAVEGADVLRGELLAPRDGMAMGSSGGYGPETRNILYFDARSNEARWLLPDSGSVISEQEIVWNDTDQAKTRREVATLALVKRAGRDLELAEGRLLVFDPAGRHLTTVAEGVRTLNHASLLDHENILVLYERSKHYVRAIVAAGTFEVKSAQEVSVPELK